MKNIDQKELIVIAAHLIITLAIIAAYAFFAYIGKPTTSIENMLLIAVGFWFAAMKRPSEQPQNQTNIQHANEVNAERAQPKQRKEV